MNFLQNIPAFFVLLGALIVVHELGHFLVARWCGVKILRFSVGFGKVLFSRRFGADQTEWAISALPLGGYVKMLDARDPDMGMGPLSSTDLQREFTQQNVWRRIAIVAAGPAANFLLAIAIYAVLNSQGVSEPIAKIHSVAEQTTAHRAGLRGGELITAVNGEAIQTWSDLHWMLAQLILEKKVIKLDVASSNPHQAGGTISNTVTLQTDSLSVQDMEGDFLAKLGLSLAQPPILDVVRPYGAAARAGLQDGDRIIKVNGMPIVDARAFREWVKISPNKQLKIQVLRQQKELNLSAIPEGVSDKGKLVGKLDVVMALPEMTVISYSPLGAVRKAVKKTWDTSILGIRLLGKMITGEISWKNITGPITIADYAGQTARNGAISFFSFMAYISISLGVMNLLPIPVLDGGLLLYYSLEVLTRRPVSERFSEIAQRAGFTILLMLMVIAFFNDIVRRIA